MSKNRGIGHWRHIDGDHLAQRVKSLALGREDSLEAGELRSDAPKWMQRVLNAVSNPKAKPDERWEEILKESEAAEKQLNEVQKAIEERRAEGTPFDV